MRQTHTYSRSDLEEMLGQWLRLPCGAKFRWKTKHIMMGMTEGEADIFDELEVEYTLEKQQKT